MKKSKYEQLGIDPEKQAVRKIFKPYIANDFPNSFVNIVRDPCDCFEHPTVFTMHMDGDGSKFVQRALHYFETGDETIFRGAVDDAWSMNMSDIAASGFVFGKFVLTDLININGLNLSKNLVMQQIGHRISELLDLYKKYGFDLVYFLGGETADLPDQTPNAIFDMGVYARTQSNFIITGNVCPGDRIYGLASDGKTIWEKEYNSGIMSNGLTLTRSCLMHKNYNKKYPFLARCYNKNTWIRNIFYQIFARFGKGFYQGRFKVQDRLDILGGLTVSEAILSPTRQWAIVLRYLFAELGQENIEKIHGISINTGGGATKIKHVGKNILYKKLMPSPPPIFQLIQKESGESWRDMYRQFNCGVGLDIVIEDDFSLAAKLKAICRKLGLTVYELGVCLESGAKENEVQLTTPYGNWVY